MAGTGLQRDHCKECNKCFNNRTGTSMARLRTPNSATATALKDRSEDLGVQATGRFLGHRTPPFCGGKCTEPVRRTPGLPLLLPTKK